MKDLSINSVLDTGLAHIQGFFSEPQLSVLEKSIFDVVCGVAASFGVSEQSGFSIGEIDKVVVEFVSRNPKTQPMIYDRLQQMPQLLAIPCLDSIQNLSRELMQSSRIGVWPRTQLRMDLPNDKRNVIRWHNDYMYNKGTTESYTFWFPIIDIDEKMGPLLFAVGSHRLNLTPIRTGGIERFDFDLSDSTVSELNVIKPQVRRGDLIVFHSLLWHSGQLNVNQDRARLSGLFRMQNLNRLEMGEIK